jgi:hypothetical protein
VGGLARGNDFDVGTPVYIKLLTAAELRKALGPSKSLQLQASSM